MRQRAVQTTVLGGLSAIAACALAAFSERLAIALAIGAVAEALIALFAVHVRRERISRLALDPSAYAIPEVDCFGRRCAEQRERERERLAEWIQEILASAHLPDSLYLADRVAQFAHELEALAGELASCSVEVEPASAVRCLRLLTRAEESPLYNPRLPHQNLALALQHIRGGIG